MNSIVQPSESPENNSASAPEAPRRRTLAVVLSWLAVCAVAVLIFWMSAKDGTTLNEHSGIISIVKAWLAGAAQAALGRPVDVSPVGHFSEYLLFGAVLANALRWHAPLRRAALSAVALASFYGVTDEIHQIFVPQRSCDSADWAVDTVAAAIGALIVFLILRRAKHAAPNRRNG